MQGLGAALSSADLAAVRRFLEEFTVRSLLPHLEARLRAVNFQVRAASMPARLCGHACGDQLISGRYWSRPAD